MPTPRQCGDCQLCCRLLPVRPLDKGANETCKFQKFHKGCTVHHTRAMPPECGLWNCRWLINDDAADLSRPDRAHLVIDLMPDFIRAVPNDGGPAQNVEVVQIWIDPKYPDAHRDPALRAWIFRRAQDGIAALIRFDARRALTLIAPPLHADGAWVEIEGQSREQTHSLAEIAKALGGRASIVID